MEKPDWWFEKATSADTTNAQNALVDYMIDEELEIDEVTAGVELSKSVLKKMSGHDERWAKVKARYFNIKDYQAHHDYHHTIINLLKSKHKLKKLLCEKRNPTKRDADKNISANISDDEDEGSNKDKISAKNLTAS